MSNSKKQNKGGAPGRAKAGTTVRERSDKITSSQVKPTVVPVIPLRDTVVFPRVGAPIMVRRPKSIKALEQAMSKDRLLVFVAQRHEAGLDLKGDDIHAVGTLVKVQEAVRQPDRCYRVSANGLSRVRIVALEDGDFLRARLVRLDEPTPAKSDRLEALTYSTVNQFRRVVGMGANVPFDVLMAVMNLTDPWFLGDLIANHLDLKVEEKQAVLEAADAEEKLELLSHALGRQIQLLQMASHIQAETGKELDKMQRETFLREQIRSIEKELEDIGARPEDDELLTRLEASKMPEATKTKALKEYGRLRQSHSSSAEATYLRSWLECLAELPWNGEAVPNIDLVHAKKCLDADHFGLEKIKDRIIEYLAVRKLTGKNRGPILCFVGPPGTGKTSIGRSIAEAVGRKFHRVSLGGVRDEAEIRGHRRTYVGAMPGRIIQGIQAVKSRSPVFMLDELDKTGSDWRGDPASALLEALDPEQNSGFSDHYLEVPFDLSEVMFIATANVIEQVPPALRDRLEVIRFPGYAEEDKVRIALDHLVPKMLDNCGLDSGRVSFAPEAIRKIIRSYTMEAGVRNLERELNSIGRKLARRQAEGKRASAKLAVRAKDVAGFLGPEKIIPSVMEARDGVGRVTGLAWTEAGGDILRIEAAVMPGKGQLRLTGHLGQVMKESAQAALTCVQSSAQALGCQLPTKETDIHVHVPAGAIPKDGPSAGAAMAAALVSLFSRRPISRQVGVTGEITLRGDILEVGGIREKVLAAHRAGLKTIVLPAANARDLVELPVSVRQAMRFVLAKRLTDVLAAVMDQPAKPGRTK